MLQGEPILILGVFRSGTSLLASVLENLGVFLGPSEDFFPPNENNPGGYWEMRPQVELNLRAYSALGINFYGVQPLPTKWMESPLSAPLLEDIRRLLNDKFGGQKLWGWKEPQTTGLVPLYREALKQEGVSPRYAICVRHPLSVAASQNARTLPGDGAERVATELTAQTMGMWVHYTLLSLLETQGAPRMVVSYEDLLSDPARVIDAIGKYLMPVPPPESQMAAAVASVKPSWNHNRYTEEDLKVWPKIVAQTYDLCLRAAVDPEGLNSGKFDYEVAAVWKRFSAMRHMVLPISLPAGQMIVSWRKGQALAQNAMKYSPTGRWQTMSIAVGASSTSPVQVDIYQTPCHVWIRKAVWLVDGAERPANLSPGPGGMLQDLFGMKRLVVFGPNPLMTQVPSSSGPATLQLEIMVASGPQVLTEVVGVLRNRLDQVRR